MLQLRTALLATLFLAAQTWSADASVMLDPFPVEPTSAQCINALETGIPLGQRPTDGASIFWLSGTAYFILVTGESFQCEAVRFPAS